MLRTFTFRLYPNATQRAALERILHDNQETYNAALQERRDAWKFQRKSISYRMQQDQLTELRKDGSYDWLACDVMRDPLRRVDRAFKAFFRRVKVKQRPGFPRFRSRSRYDSFGWSSPTFKAGRLRVPNLGTLRTRGGREAISSPKIATVKRGGNRWWAKVVCDIGEAPAKAPIRNAVGIDLGVSTLVTLSDGHQIENPRWVRKHEARIAACNRRLALKQKRSKNRVKAREILRRAHQAAANTRANYLHHVSKWLLAHYDLIAYEDLKIRNMVKSNLAKSILDAAWGELIWQLTYKAESAGRWVVPVDPRGTSQRCSQCGEVVKKTLADRRHVCTCGANLDRDHNAALNVLRLGKALCGASQQNVYSCI